MGGDFAIPPAYQLLSSVFIAVILAVGAVIQYYKASRKLPPSNALPAFDMRMIGAAMNDTQALARIADSLEHLCATLDRREDRENEHRRGEVDRHRDGMDRMERLIAALERDRRSRQPPR